MSNYYIRDFNKTTGEILVEFPEHGEITISLHIDQDGKYITGESLNSYINGFLPYKDTYRENIIKTGVSNVDEITNLIIPKEKVVLTLDDAKAKKITDFSLIRYAKEITPISYKDNQYSSDRTSRGLLLEAINALKTNNLLDIDYKIKNGVFVKLTLIELEEIYKIMCQNTQILFSYEKELVDNINAASTLEELDLIDF